MKQANEIKLKFTFTSGKITRNHWLNILTHSNQILNCDTWSLAYSVGPILSLNQNARIPKQLGKNNLEIYKNLN